MRVEFEVLRLSISFFACRLARLGVVLRDIFIYLTFGFFYSQTTTQ